jgi:hypothetical protein
VLPLLFQRAQHQLEPGQHVPLLQHRVADGELQVAEGGGEVGEAPGVAQVHAQDARHLVGDALHRAGHGGHRGQDLLHQGVGVFGRGGNLLHLAHGGRVVAVFQPHVGQHDAAESLQRGLDGAAGKVQPVEHAHGGGDLLQRLREKVVFHGGHHRHHQVVLRVLAERLHVGREPDLQRRGPAGEHDGAADGEHRHALRVCLAGCFVSLHLPPSERLA